MDLREWILVHINYLNSFKKNLKNIRKEEKILLCEYEEGNHFFHVESELTSEVFKKLEKEKSTIVCLNNKKNMAFLISNWSEFAEHKNLKIMFVNPKVNMQWSLLPHIHNQITEKTALKAGLRALFNSVPSA